MKKIINIDKSTIIVYFLTLISNVYLLYATYMNFHYNVDLNFLYFIALFVDFHFIFYYILENYE